jgi:hypothetical protein
VPVFSAGRAPALVFSPGRAPALVFSPGSAKVAERVGAGLQAERLAERVFFPEREVAPEPAGVGRPAARASGEPLFSLGREEA